MQPSVLQRDGQAQAGAAGGPGTGPIRAPEAVEDQRRFARLQAHPVVANRDCHRVVVNGHPDDDIIAFAVLHRVHHQVPQHTLDTT